MALFQILIRTQALHVKKDLVHLQFVTRTKRCLPSHLGKLPPLETLDSSPTRRLLTAQHPTFPQSLARYDLQVAR